MALASGSSFKLAFEVSLTGCSYTYKTLKQKSVLSGLLLPYRLYQCISDQGQPFLHILNNSTAMVDFHEKMTT